MARTSAASPGAETRSTDPSSTGAPVGGSNSPRRRRARPSDGGGGGEEPGAERRAAQGRGQLAAEHVHGPEPGQCSHEVALDRIELEVVEDEHLRLRLPACPREALRRRREQRGGVGGPPLERLVEAAVEAGEGAEAVSVPRGVARAVGKRRELLRKDAPPAQGLKRSGEGGRHRPPRQVGGQAEAFAPFG